MNYIADLVNQFGTGPVVIALIGASAWYANRTEKRLKDGDEKFKLIERNMMVIGRVALRLEIVNEKMPLQERVRAYEQYVNDFQGNGAITEYYEKKIKPKLANEFDKNAS